MSDRVAFDVRRPVRTRSGFSARIICADRVDAYLPILALFARPGTGEMLIAARADGKVTSHEHPQDLVNVPDDEATYPVNPLIQLLADPSPEEFRNVLGRLRVALEQHQGRMDDTSVALAIMVGMMQEVRARVSLPLVFADAVQELQGLRALAACLGAGER